MWEEEISPEEMFRQFFGGGMGMGGPFGELRGVLCSIQHVTKFHNAEIKLTCVLARRRRNV